MLRAMKKISKLVTRWCFNIKKSGNRRRMVIIVALIGVYYLGKHSSSLNFGGSEGEKRYIRHPLRNRTRTGLVVEPPKQLKKSNGYIYFGDLLGDRDNKLLQKERSNDDRTYHNDNTKLNKIKMVTPSITAEQTKQHKKVPPVIQHKALSQHRDDDRTLQSTNKADAITNHAVRSIASMASTDGDNTDQPKSIVTTDKRTPTTKPTVSQTISTEGSTIHNSEGNTSATPVHSDNVKVNEVDVHLRDLINDKKLFGFIDKNNATDQLQYVNILRVQTYANILKHQMARKAKPSSETSDDFLNKYGYSKATSDAQPLLRDVPDNRDPKYVT